MLQEALDIVHVSKEDQESVFAMLAAVLWLGNVSFTVIDNENHVEPVADESKHVHSTLCFSFLVSMNVEFAFTTTSYDVALLMSFIYIPDIATSVIFFCYLVS